MKPLFVGDGLSGRLGNPETGQLMGLRLIQQILKLGIVGFATGK